MSAVERRPAASVSAAPESSPALAAREPLSDPADFASADLTKEQVVVLRAIAGGKSISAAAREAGINRCTIHRWQRDSQFQYWLQAWQSQAKESGRNIMLTLIERSARIVERALDKDDLRVALTLLTKLGVLADKDLPAMSSVGVLGRHPAVESSANAIVEERSTARTVSAPNPADLKSFRA